MPTQTEQTYTITFTEAERKAVIGWADASGQGFHYGPAPEGWAEEPAQTARTKLDEAASAGVTDAMVDRGWRELEGATRVPLTQRDQEQFRRALRAALGLDPWGES